MLIALLPATSSDFLSGGSLLMIRPAHSRFSVSTTFFCALVIVSAGLAYAFWVRIPVTPIFIIFRVQVWYCFGTALAPYHFRPHSNPYVFFFFLSC